MILDPNQIALEDLKSYRRFNIVGTAGSGKSTFGRELAAVLAIPFFEMDQLFWKPGWRESPDEEFMEKVSVVVAKDAWVLDGNYTRTVPIKWRRTQLVVWIDLPFMTTVARVTKRAVNRSITGAELWPGTGNRETLKKAFLSRRSIIWWSIKYYAANRKKYQRIMEAGEYPELSFLRLSSTTQVARMLGRTV